MRAGKRPRRRDYPLTPSLHDRTVGMVGLGRIGKAITRRLDAMGVPVVYHTRRPQADVTYKHYPKLIDMARDADVLLVITPGGAATRNLINAEVLKARPERHPDQHGARLRGGRGGADQGAAGAARSSAPVSTCSPMSRMCRRS